MNRVLPANQYKYVLLNPCPEIREDSTEEEREAEKAQKNDDEMARY